jgi:predicted Fe-S protein YdhL (DUF1289 family)
MCGDTGSSVSNFARKHSKRRAQTRRLHLKAVMTLAQLPILSPCIGICELDRDGYCKGCLRSGDEIARWVSMGEVERRRLVDDVLPQRETRQP